MAKQKWTTEQTDAISSRGSDLLVSAAAGAGKTAVLVERIIRSITDPVKPADIDRLLVVTFTNAAAAEMRERIGLALVAELEKFPEADYLRRQLTRLGSASIMTLHAFCLDVLRQYYYCIDLDPAFKMCNDAETVLLQDQALEKVFEELYTEGEEPFLMLADMYGGSRDDRKLAEIVLKLYKYARSHPRPRRWLQQAVEEFAAFGPDYFEQSPWITEIKQYLQTQLQGCRAKISLAALLAKESQGLAGYAAVLEADGLCIEDMLGALHRNWLCLAAAFDEKLAGALPRIKGEYDEAAKEKVQQLRREVKKLLGKLKNDFFTRSGQEWQEDARRLVPTVQALVTLVNTFADEYAALKTAKGLLDFSDLEHKCLEILRGEDAGESLAAADLSRRYTEIMVDEYQDINEVQETILALIAQPGAACVPRFMVGDVKQSIYRFRLAEPSLFLDKYNTYNQTSGAGRRIDLAANFRSSAQVIDAVNYLFRQIMTPYVGEMSYDQKARLVCGLGKAAEILPKVEIQLIEKTQNTKNNPGEEEDDGAEEAEAEENLAGFAAEANIIAQRVGEMIKNSDRHRIFDKQLGEERPLEYRDIVILLRATKGKAELLLDVLRKYDIPCYAEVSGGYFAATEIKIMLSLLQIIDNPRQDIPLAAVLRSPILGLQAEELAEIRNCLPRGDFWDALQSYTTAGMSGSAKLGEFIRRLDEWRTVARRQPLSVLIWQLLQETGIYDYVGSMPGGVQRQANLRALYTRACQYEQTNFRGLFRFLRFIEMLRQSGSDLATARTLGENENVVRIMSVHKSKGLEFPVVFIADIGKRFNRTDLYGPVLCHKELGLGPEIVEPERRVRYPSLARKAVQLRLNREVLSEELRILYVALTRAREGLILVGTVNNPAKHKERWSNFLHWDEETLPEWFLAEANSWLDWIAPAVARHPAGKALRTESVQRLVCSPRSPDPSQWAITIWDQETAGNVCSAATNNDASLFMKLERLTYDAGIILPAREMVNNKLNWCYPHPAAQGYPAKLAVSDLKQAAGEEATLIPQEMIYQRPRFLQARETLNAAERGSAVHVVMQRVNLQDALTEDSLRVQINQLTARHILTEAQAEAVDTAAIAAFFRTKLGRRLGKAEEVWRELNFSMMVDANRLYPEITGEQIFVQGVIDCLFRDAAGTVLIDYKTDQAGTGIAPERQQAYRQQITIYAEAATQLLRHPVTEAYLYFLATQELIKLA